MTRFLVTTVTAGALAAAALGLAGTAAAFPSGGSAADTVTSLEAEGYNVQLNGIASAPLSRCSVTGIHPKLNDSASIAEKQNTTVFIDVSCPSHSD
jgi:hypothetical protein